jgi:peroxiredoxin
MGRLKVLIGVIGILTFSFVPITFAQIKVGQRVPDFVTSTLDGKRFALKEYLKQPENKVLILTFFATWCEPCGEDLKYLKRLHSQYGNQGLGVFCVFTGRLSKVKAAKKYLEDLDINFPVLLDKKRVISKRYKVTGLPCNYAIDREGFLKFRCLGCSEDVKRKFAENLKDLLSYP